jgi:HSP20 family molecular chaperone IbpA
MNKTLIDLVDEIFANTGNHCYTGYAGCKAKTESTEPEYVNFRVNTEYTETEGKILLEVAGVEQEDISVTLESNVLAVSVTKKLQKPIKFEKTWTIPVDYDRDSVWSSLKNGILTITIPKFKSAIKRTIKVQ